MPRCGKCVQKMKLKWEAISVKEEGTRADGLVLLVISHQPSRVHLATELNRVTIRRQHDLLVLLSLSAQSGLAWTSDSQ